MPELLYFLLYKLTDPPNTTHCTIVSIYIRITVRVQQMHKTSRNRFTLISFHSVFGINGLSIHCSTATVRVRVRVELSKAYSTTIGTRTVHPPVVQYIQRTSTALPPPVAYTYSYSTIVQVWILVFETVFV